MFKIDQFTAANEAAINQFAYLSQLTLANVERFAGEGRLDIRRRDCGHHRALDSRSA